MVAYALIKLFFSCPYPYTWAPLELLAETLILGGQKTLFFMKKRVL